MYFAILWKNPEISLHELELVKAKEISFPKKGIVIFDTKYKELLPQLWWIIKVGTVVKEKELQEILSDVKIIGIQNEANGKHLKNTIGIRRYKLVDIFHTDREIKNKWKEIINLENGLYGIVEQYQNIELYEDVDFGKPWRSMEMGMMPGKLAQIMVNIWLSNLIHNSDINIDDICIYDPFVWSGTTWFIANYLGYDFVGSDININYAEQNALWRKTSKFYTADKQFTIFNHDILSPRKHPQPKNIFGEKIPNLIVTEWRLGPIIKARMSESDIQSAQKEVMKLYEWFILQIHNLFLSQEQKPIIICTIPIYPGDNYIESGLIKLIGELKSTKTTDHRTLSSIPEIYQRENQHIGRKILIIQQ